MSQERPTVSPAAGVVIGETRRNSAKARKRKKVVVARVKPKTRPAAAGVYARRNVHFKFDLADHDYDPVAGLNLAQDKARRAVTTGALKEHRTLYERLIAQMMESVGIKPVK
jgi:hypothetical protein